MDYACVECVSGVSKIKSRIIHAKTLCVRLVRSEIYVQEVNRKQRKRSARGFICFKDSWRKIA